MLVAVVPMYVVYAFATYMESAWNLSQLSLKTIDVPVQILLETVALALLFSPPASRWYRARSR